MRAMMPARPTPERRGRTGIVACYDDPSPMASRALFLTFEGIDGSGKSTQLQMLSARLRDRGMEVTTAREPGGTAIGDAIRRILLDSATQRLAPEAELLLYFASRAQNVSEVIAPALAEGRVVLCDRYVDASAAYQGYGRGLGTDAVMHLEKIACRGLKPARTWVLDIEPSTAVARALERNRGAAASGSSDESRFERESLEFFARVRRGYLEIAAREPSRVVVVNAERPIEAIHAEIWSDAVRLLGVGD